MAEVRRDGSVRKAVHIRPRPFDPAAPGAPTVFEDNVSAQSALRAACAARLLALFAVSGRVLARSRSLPPLPPKPGGAGEEVAGDRRGSTPFDRQGMWIWYVDQSEGGSIAGDRRPRQAADGIGTRLHQVGRRRQLLEPVQLRPGRRPPRRRARRLRLAVRLRRQARWPRPGSAPPRSRRGADCLVIDAEADYEGRYAAADLYIRALRARDRRRLPALARRLPLRRLPPGLPLLGLPRARRRPFNQPQMYWKAIGTSVRTVFEHTYLYNRLWGRPIYPIGQTYEDPGAGQVLRSSAASPPATAAWRRAGGTGRRPTAPSWGALGSTAADRPGRLRPIVEHPLLKRGSHGDLVVWAQEHLVARRADAAPRHRRLRQADLARAVRSFQEAHGLAADGAIGTTTWSALLDAEPVRVRWAARPARGRTGIAGRSNPPFTVSGTEKGGRMLQPVALSLPRFPRMPMR